MKLYAKAWSSEGGRTVNKGSNDVLVIELFCGNNIQGQITMNAYNGELVYSILGDKQFIPVYREKLKGKTEQS